MTSNVLPLHFTFSQTSSSQNSNVDDTLEGYKIKSCLLDFTLEYEIRPNISALCIINFDRVQFQIMESGMMDYIGTKWKGQEIPQSQDSDLMILSGGQTLLIFLIMVSAFGLSFIIFIGELINSKLENVKKNLSRKKKKKLKKTFPKIIVHSKSVKLSNINE